VSSKRGCKRLRRWDFRYLYLAPVLALLLAGSPGSAVKGGRFGAADLPIVKATTTAQLSAAGEIQLHAIMDAAELADLHWPAFGKYQGEVRDFYDSSERSLPWMRPTGPGPQALAIIRLLNHSDSEGLYPEDYDVPRWEGRLQALGQRDPAPESDRVRFDVALTVSVMRYISDLHLGRVNPHLILHDLALDDTNFDLSGFLRDKLVNASDKDIQIAIEAVEPPFPTYHRTRNALATYLELSRRDDGELLPTPRKAIKPGDSYTGLSRLTRLLGLLGDLSDNEKGVAHPGVYGEPLVSAVKRYQQRHGLEPNGLINWQTLQDLNTPLNQRVAQLQLTLERLRWMPHQFQRPPIVVNIPEFRLRAVDEQYHWVLSMKVVVGRAYRNQTPVFTSGIKSVIFSPYWNVPLSIVRAELLPDIHRDPAYLARNRYEIVDSAGAVVSQSAVTEGIERQLRSGKLGIRQMPGPDNALGLLKFDFPNAHDVYMHGTPATQLFSRSRRDFSHGCIRVEDPVALATWLLRDQPGWTAAHVRAATLEGKTLRVDLERPVPVLIVYGTALVMENGEVHFFRDIYGQDALLEKALLTRSHSE